MGSKLPQYLGNKVDSVLAQGENIILEFSSIIPRQKSNGIPSEEYGSGITITDRRTIITKVRSRQMITPGMLKQLDKIYAGRIGHPKVFLDESSFIHSQVDAVVVNRGLAPTIQIFRKGENFKPVVMTIWNVGHAQDIENACIFDNIERAFEFQKMIENLIKKADAYSKPGGASSIADQIRELDNLRRSGIISDSEFESGKKKILQ